MPRISVILSSLNHGPFIAQAVQSVLDQTFEDFELFIIDDCSNDDSWKIIKGFDDSRIVAVRNPVRMRGIYGFNKTIRELAGGEYIAIHHSDDVFLADKLAQQVRALDHTPSLGAVFTHVQLIDDSGAPFTDAAHPYQGVFDQPNRSRYEWLNFFFHRGNALCHPSAMIRRHCFDEVGYYDRRLGQLGDFDFWVRLCMRYEIHVLQHPLTCFRVRQKEANQSGNKPETRIRVAMEYQQVLKAYLEIPTVEMLLQVFPDIRKLVRTGDNVIPFLVALYATRQAGSKYQAFGINQLYELMSDTELAQDIEEKHGFRYPDLIQLVGEKDIFDMRHQVPAEQTIAMLEQELTRVKKTVSWKATRPLRLIANLPRLIRTWAAR